MPIIYEPRGRAREYCGLAANLYRGWTWLQVLLPPAATRADREKFFEPVPRKMLSNFQRRRRFELKFKGRSRCASIAIPINKRRIRPGRESHPNSQGNGKMSKGGKRAEKDLSMLGAGDKVGATLTFTDPADSLEWEPGAAPPAERFALLEKAKSLGLTTWASLEPVIDPEQSLEIIRRAHEYVDTFKVGTLNHHPLAREIDWYRFGSQAVELLDELGCGYYIKNDLRKHLEQERLFA